MGVFTIEFSSSKVRPITATTDKQHRSLGDDAYADTTVPVIKRHLLYFSLGMYAQDSREISVPEKYPHIKRKEKYPAVYTLLSVIIKLFYNSRLM